MDYKEYIDLGFSRLECDDNIEYERIGYCGFILIRTLTNGVYIEASSKDLNNPKLYIKEKMNGNYYSLLLNKEQILQLLK